MEAPNKTIAEPTTKGKVRRSPMKELDTDTVNRMFIFPAICAAAAPNILMRNMPMMLRKTAQKALTASKTAAVGRMCGMAKKGSRPSTARVITKPKQKTAGEVSATNCKGDSFGQSSSDSYWFIWQSISTERIDRAKRAPMPSIIPSRAREVLWPATLRFRTPSQLITASPAIAMTMPSQASAAKRRPRRALIRAVKTGERMPMMELKPAPMYFNEDVFMTTLPVWRSAMGRIRLTYHLAPLDMASLSLK
mmetsp:Transcript_39446/g.65113  ORF Transcript_39446/g.65113 Transcript_39446/m.65113 type:complete len:250 (-) Transcript_39446:360-1109(-)